MNPIVRIDHVSKGVMLALLLVSAVVYVSEKSPISRQVVSENAPMNLNPYSWYQKHKAEQRKVYQGDKPPFCKMGYYSGGRHVDFSFDLKGLSAALVAGSCFRMLYSVSQYGTKLDTMKKSILYPGFAKSGFFWLPGLVAYSFVVSDKDHDRVRHENEELARRLYEAQTNSNSLFK